MTTTNSTAPALLSREHLATIGIDSSPHGEIVASRENFEQLRTLPITHVGGTAFPEIEEATPDNLERAMKEAEAILAQPGEDKLSIAKPVAERVDRPAFDVTDFSDAVTFYL